jgi:hypothetical protein
MHEVQGEALFAERAAGIDIATTCSNTTRSGTRRR